MLRVGQKLTSFCNGYFGSEFYAGRVEAVGFDWVVARRSDGYPVLAYFEDGVDSYADIIAKWNEDETKD